MSRRRRPSTGSFAITSRASSSARPRGAAVAGLPAYVRQEFERFLDCGILAHGFARVRCPDCGYDTVVGFS